MDFLQRFSLFCDACRIAGESTAAKPKLPRAVAVHMCFLYSSYATALAEDDPNRVAVLKACGKLALWAAIGSGEFVTVTDAGFEELEPALTATCLTALAALATPTVGHVLPPSGDKERQLAEFIKDLTRTPLAGSFDRPPQFLIEAVTRVRRVANEVEELGLSLSAVRTRAILRTCFEAVTSGPACTAFILTTSEQPESSLQDPPGLPGLAATTLHMCRLASRTASGYELLLPTCGTLLADALELALFMRALVPPASHDSLREDRYVCELWTKHYPAALHKVPALANEDVKTVAEAMAAIRKSRLALDTLNLHAGGNGKFKKGGKATGGANAGAAEKDA